MQKIHKQIFHSIRKSSQEEEYKNKLFLDISAKIGADG